jgi:hypothetical protein
MSGHHSHHPRESRFGSFLSANSVEIIAAAVVGLGIFLILERMNIRLALLQAAGIGVQNALHAIGHVDDAVADLIARITLSNALGFVLVLGAGIAIVLRVRWRLVQTESLTTLRCPRCGGSIHRVHRRLGDRAISWFVLVRRYSCWNRECRWCGIRVATSKHGPDPTDSAE